MIDVDGTIKRRKIFDKSGAFVVRFIVDQGLKVNNYLIPCVYR